MVSTITESVATVLPTAAVSLGITAMVGLIALLISREFSNATEGARSRLFRQHIDVGMIPLLGVFLFTVITVLS